MYDSRSEPREFVGATRSEAIAKACAYFGTAEGSLKIRNAEAGEIYGLAAREVIVAVPADAAPRRSAPSRPAPREDGPRRGPGGREGGREGGRDGGRDRGPRRDDRRGERSDEGRFSGNREPERRSEPALDEAPIDGPSEGTARSDLGDSGQFVRGLIERLGLGPFEISESEDGELVVVQLRGPAATRLAGGDGRAVDAIQFLVNQVALRQSESARRVVIDAEGDPDRRDSHLERLAERAAQRARETSRAVALDPMNARDRRVIHVALRDVDGVATMSVGVGRYRQVVVVPEGAPEYEQARRQAESAGQGNS